MKIVNPTAVIGEDAATQYIRDKSYKILERNFRKGYGEIDIIALQPARASGQANVNGILVFIEVKTRTSSLFGSPFESILPSKLKTIIKTAQYYKYVHPNLPEDIRFDAIGVIVENKEVKSIEHLENITGF